MNLRIKMWLLLFCSQVVMLDSGHNSRKVKPFKPEITHEKSHPNCSDVCCECGSWALIISSFVAFSSGCFSCPEITSFGNSACLSDQADKAPVSFHVKESSEQMFDLQARYGLAKNKLRSYNNTKKQ